MKLINLFLSFFFVFSEFLLAQDTITVYFDANWDEISNMSHASFYRKAYKEDFEKWKVNDYYISNKIQMTGFFKSNKFKVKHGHFIYYYENGNKSSEGEYINDKNEGLWTSWFENGEKKSEGLYKNDLKQGEWVFWFEGGTKNYIGLYVDDKGEGLWQYWYETGEKRIEGNYLHDEEEGPWKYFYKTGALEMEDDYKNGKIITSNGYFENGNLKFTGKRIDTKGNEEWIYYNIDRNIYMKGNYFENKKVGEWTRFFKNGESIKMYYENGKLVSKPLGGIMLN